MHIAGGMLEVEGGSIYYETAGEGIAIVFNHAGFVDSRMWDAQWAFFAENYRVVRFDMRGYGRSSPIINPISHRDDLARVLKHLGIERAVLIGCSMGGEIALDFALEHPDIPLALVLASSTPTAFEMQGEPPRYLMEMIRAAQNGELDKTSELQLRVWVDGMYREPDQVDADVRAQAGEMNRIFVERGTFFADMQPLNPLDPPAVGRLAEVQIPALIVDGALDHPEILRAGDVMVAGMPDAQKVVLPDSAHVPNMEQPALFNRAVQAFLERVGMG